MKWSLLKKNWKALAGFAMLHMAVSAVAVLPLLRRGSYLIMRIVGFRYLTAENIFRFLRNPIVFFALLLLALIYTAFEFLEISGTIYLIDRSQNDDYVTFWDALIFAWVNLKGLFRRHYVGLLFMVLLLTPMYHLSATINLMNNYMTISTLRKMIYRNRPLFILICTLVLIAVALFIRWMFVPHLYSLENYSAKQSRMISRRMAGAVSLKKLFSLFLQQVSIFAVYTVISFAVLAAIGLLRKFSLSGSVVSSVQVALIQMMSGMLDAVILPVMLLKVSSLYRDCEKQISHQRIYADRVCRAENLPEKRTLIHSVLINGQKSRRIERAMLAVSMLAFVSVNVYQVRNQFHLRIEHLGSVEVTAHRGASMFYPENTMAAFVGSVEQGADWIELDVQETKDKQIIVLHDESLKRTTGVDKRAGDLTYEEIQTFDAGSFFNREYEGESIPLLSEVIDFAKEADIRLNIELKPGKGETDLVQLVMDIIEEKEFVSQCVITSQKYEVLREVKKRNEDMYTVYVMGLAYGAVSRLKAADAFSIRATSLTQSLVTDLHNRGLEVYAWTVDSRSNINRMIDLGVDNIITNNVPMARECINTSRTDSLLWELLRIRLENLRE